VTATAQVQEHQRNRRLHPAWTVAAVTFLALIAAAAFRSSTGVLIEPVEAEFGWSRAWTSSAVSVNLVLFGLTAPFAAALMERFGLRRVVAAALTLVALGSGLTLDRPEDIGVKPYGATKTDNKTTDGQSLAKPEGPARIAVRELRSAARTRAFWILFFTFFICGWSTNGLIQTHFVPMAHDHGMPPTTAASLLAVVGIFDIIGTIGSGWLSDRVDARVLLFVYYGLRGLSLLAGPAVMGSRVEPPLLFFIVFYGLDWVATVPPTVALCRQQFGTTRSSVVFGWVYAGHMVGAGIAAEVAGQIRETTGSYSDAWWTAGGLCLIAAVVVFGIRTQEDPEANG